MGRYEKNEKQRQLVVGTELIIRRPNQFYFGLMMVLMTFENLFALKLFLRKVDATVGSIAIAQQKNFNSLKFESNNFLYGRLNTSSILGASCKFKKCFKNVCNMTGFFW